LQDQEVALALLAAGGALRPVRDLFIRPSQDLGKLAADVLSRPAVKARLSGPAGYLMRRVGENAVETQDPSDLLSYLLFDGEYARSWSRWESGTRTRCAASWRHSSPGREPTATASFDGDCESRASTARFEPRLRGSRSDNRPQIGGLPAGRAGERASTSG